MPPSTSQPTLAVLAAGIGSRYGGLKQIDPVGPGGEIVLDYSVFDAIRSGFGRIVFVIRREIEESFRAIVEPHFAGRIPVSYVYQELTDVPAGMEVPAARAKPWGTGHAVYACRGEIREPFAVINADDFYGRRSFELLAESLSDAGRSPRFSMVAFILRNTLSEHGPVARGVCRVDEKGLLAGVTERMGIERHGEGVRCKAGEGWEALTGNEHVSMNCWGFTPALFEHMEREFRLFLPRAAGEPGAEFQLPAVIDTCIREGRASVRVAVSPDRWMGVTYPADKPAVAAGVRALVEKGLYPERLWA